MAVINDPRVNRFLNESLRPFAEILRDTILEAAELDSLWDRGISELVGNSEGDTINDGRQNEGISRLTAKDVSDFMDVVTSIIQLSRGSNTSGISGAFNIVRKPTVRRTKFER